MAYALTSRSVSAAPRIGVLTRLAAGMSAWRQRRALARVDAHLRADLGLSLREVETEIRRPLWDVPNALLR